MIEQIVALKSTNINKKDTNHNRSNKFIQQKFGAVCLDYVVEDASLAPTTMQEVMGLRFSDTAANIWTIILELE